jgi:hypothetical protein
LCFNGARNILAALLVNFISFCFIVMKKRTWALVIGVVAVVAAPMFALAGASFFIDDTTSYVGIGNTTPQARLDVSGAMYSRLASATTTTISWNAGNVQSYTLTGNSTFVFNNGQAGGKYDLILSQDGTGNRTVTWPGSIKWTGHAPTMSSDPSATNVFSFLYDGTYFYGSQTYKPVTAIAFDAVNSSQGTANPYTFSHTSSGSNLVGLVSIQALAGDVVSAVTWGGNAMTLVDKQNRGDGRYDSLWIITAPATGSQTISITNSGSNQIKARAITYTGAAQSGQPDISNKTTNSSASSISLSFTTSTIDDWLVGIVDTTSAGASASTNTYQRQSVDDATFWDSNGPQGAAGSYSLNWSLSPSSGNNSIIGVAIKPAP